MTTKMNPEVKAKWTAALRSGDYGQAKQTLRAAGTNNFCCLGVLCDLHRQAIGGEWQGEAYNKDKIIQPAMVDQWAGMADLSSYRVPMSLTLRADARLVKWYADEPYVGLASLNDRGFSFAEIADLIDAHL